MPVNKTVQLTESVYEYLFRNGVREPDVLRRLREETYALGEPAGMISPPEAAQFLAMLVQITGARRVIEIGVFTGYTTLAKALALPQGGKIFACDHSAEWAAIGQRYWKEAGVADKIDLRLGPAVDSLEALIADGESGSFDLIFIDADKPNIDAYYEAGLKLVRPGGLVVIDNVLWSGRVADSTVDDAGTVAIRALNAKVVLDERVSMVMIPVADGITLCRKSG